MHDRRIDTIAHAVPLLLSLFFLKDIRVLSREVLVKCIKTVMAARLYRVNARSGFQSRCFYWPTLVMPRPVRIEYEGAVYRIAGRGNAR